MLLWISRIYANNLLSDSCETVRIEKTKARLMREIEGVVSELSVVAQPDFSVDLTDPGGPIISGTQSTLKECFPELVKLIGMWKRSPVEDV